MKWSKYGNRKTYVGEILFDSAHEAKRYTELKLMERAGEIRELRLQVPYELIPQLKDENGKVVYRATHYVADFVYVDARTGRTVVEDAKGYVTDAYRLKRKMMMWIYDIRIVEV